MKTNKVFPKSMVVLTILNILLASLMFAPVVGANMSPKITDIILSPEKVVPGDVMEISAHIKDSSGVSTVYVDMGKIETVYLKLASGNAYDGIWKGTWNVHDTEVKRYYAVVTAKNRLGFSASSKARWSDPISTYDFNSGAGVDRWAYGYEVDYILQCSDTFPNEELSGSEYNLIARGDNSYFDSGDPDRRDEAAIRYKIEIEENPLDITEITVLWTGYGSSFRDIELYIWNYDSSSYKKLDENGNTEEFSLFGSVDTDLQKYISPGGYLTFLTYYTGSNENLYTDYVEVEIAYTPGSSSPPPTTSRTDYPRWSYQEQDRSAIHKDESITLSARWTDPDGFDRATLMTNGSGSWQTVATVSLGGNNNESLSSFTLTPDDLANWIVGNVGWKIGAYSASGGYNETDVMTFELWGRSFVSWISPPPSYRSPYELGSDIELKARVMDATNIHGLIGEYYDNSNLTVPKTIRIDPNINFDWGSGTPSGTNITDSDTFYVVWNGRIEIENTENVTFYTASDDGSTLSIDGVPVVDNWGNRSDMEEKSGTINLTKGFHEIDIIYFEDTDDAKIKVSWSSETISKGVIPEDNLYPFFKTPIQDYPVEFWWYNDTESEYLGQGITDDTGHATLNWDTTGLSGGTYHVKANITDNPSVYSDVTGGDEAEGTVYIYSATIEETLRGRRWFGAGLLAYPVGGLDWASVNFTGGRVPIGSLSNAYNLSMNVEINGMDMDTTGKQLGPLFVTYNFKGLRIVDIPSIVIAIVQYVLHGTFPMIDEGHHPILYVTLGMWTGDNIIAGGLGVTHTAELAIPLYGIEGLTLWMGSTAREEEPFLRWFANTGVANEIADLENTYPSTDIVEYDTQLIILVTELLHDLRVDLLDDLIPIILWLFDLDSYVPVITDFLDIDMIIGVIVGNLVNFIVDAVKFIVVDFADLSEIALQNHSGDVAYLMNTTAERLPDIVGDAEGTTGLTYVLRNMLDVPQPVIQSLVDEILLLVNWIGYWIPEIVDLVEAII